MKLTLLLACLWLDYYFDTGSRWRSHAWLEKYVHAIKSIFGGKKSLWGGPVSIALVLVPLFVVILIIWSIAARFSGLVELIVGFVILWYCFGPNTVQEALSHYLKKGEVAPNAEAELKNAVSEKGMSGSFHRNVTELIFWQAHERFFGVIFWFLVFGPAGAVIFRLASWMEENANRLQADFYPQFPQHIHQLYWIIAWIPARLAALSYTLFGNFAPGFDKWQHEVLKANQCKEILIDSGMASMNLEGEATREENLKAQGIVQRGILIWVLVAAVATLGHAFL